MRKQQFEATIRVGKVGNHNIDDVIRSEHEGFFIELFGFIIEQMRPQIRCRSAESAERSVTSSRLTEPMRSSSAAPKAAIASGVSSKVSLRLRAVTTAVPVTGQTYRLSIELWVK